MQKINVSIPQNKEPWLLPTPRRVALVQEAKKRGKHIALIVYEQPDTSTFRYRAYNVMQATLQSEKWQAVYFYMSELPTILELLPVVHELIFSRVRWTHSVDMVVAHAKADGIPVLFDVDDLIFDLDYLNMVTNTLNVHFGGERDYEFWFACISRIGFTASKADGFIATNDFLGNRLTKKFGKPHGILPNSLNKEQLDISNRCVQQKRRAYRSDPFTVGYFSGTPSHINDFKVVYKELVSFLESHRNAVLKVVGFMEFPEELTPLIAARRITFTPLVDFMELQRLIAEVDVNIVPLVNNTFTNCKSELKFFEAAVVRTPTIATPTYTYAKAITHGETGFLCTPGNWANTLDDIYRGGYDLDCITAQAHAYALDHYSGEGFLRKIEHCYDQFL